MPTKTLQANRNVPLPPRKIESGTFFFTLALADRQSDLLVSQVDRLRRSYQIMQQRLARACMAESGCQHTSHNHNVAILFSMVPVNLTVPLEDFLMGKRTCDSGLDDRGRDHDGEIRHKRRDTLVGTLRQTYGADFAKGYRSDAKLGTVLEGEGADTLSELLKRR